MSDTEVCRTAMSARQSGDNAFISMVNEEGARRRLTSEKCNTLIAESDKDAATAAVVLVGVAAIALASQRDGGSGTPASQPEYAWGRAYNDKRQLVWVCREVKTGELEEPYHCRNQPKPNRQ